ncbi:MAG: M48 family metallopeptidase, partial [Nitrospinota bacterium]
YDSGPAVEAVERIGKRLTGDSRFVYRWFVAKQPELNAFAAPGGVVVVFSGLLKSIRTPEELAGVLAHEIAHAELRHSLLLLVKNLGIRALISFTIGDFSGGALTEALAGLTELKFSRDAEREADLDGLRRLQEAQIDPRGMVSFFELMEKKSSLNPPEILSTHPAPKDRLETLRNAVSALKIDPVPLDVNLADVKASFQNTEKGLGPQNHGPKGFEN